MPVESRTGLKEPTDRLGDEFMKTVPASERRKTGSTYTPWSIVTSMMLEAASACEPDIIVDCENVRRKHQKHVFRGSGTHPM